MGWMQVKRAVFCDTARVVPAARSGFTSIPVVLEARLFARSQGDSCPKLSYRQVKPFVCQVCCLERACSPAEALSSLECFHENIADHGDHINHFLMLALPPTAPSLLAPKVFYFYFIFLTMTMTSTTQSLACSWTRQAGIAEEVGVRGLRRSRREWWWPSIQRPCRAWSCVDKFCVCNIRSNGSPYRTVLGLKVCRTVTVFEDVIGLKERTRAVKSRN